jgi:hypothetical protein
MTPTGPVRGHNRREVEATVTLVDQWQPVELYPVAPRIAMEGARGA